MICPRIATVASWNATTTGPRVFSYGADLCNIGDAPVTVISSTNQHPVSVQGLYRISAEGRLEQIGLSWVSHQFCVLQNGGVCGTCTPVPVGCTALGLNCSSNSNASIMGSQGNLGPRSEVNSLSGAFVFPFTGQGATGGVEFKRIQVNPADMDPSLNAGATYLAEMHFVAPDDSAANAGFNNASSREMLIIGSDGLWNLQPTGLTNISEPAIERWPVHVPGAVVVDALVPGDGLFHVGAYVRDNLNGTWTYNYAVHNLNSDRSAYSFTVGAAPLAETMMVDFHDIDYHSGEPYTNADWTSSETPAGLTWQADATFAENPNANALRWGTTYSFSFLADGPPVSGTTTVQLFKPGGVGAPGAVTATLPVPGNPLLVGDTNCDGVISVGDISSFVLALTDPAGYAAAFPGCDIDTADINADGVVSVGDISGFVALLTR